MITGRRWSVLVVIALAAVGLVVGPGIASGANQGSEHLRNGIKLSPIGNPTWRPVDLRLFSAPIGTEASGYAEFTEQQSLCYLPRTTSPSETSESLRAHCTGGHIQRSSAKLSGP
jgi:hypothetical protein